MPKIVGKRGKAINASNNFQAFKLLFRIFSRFQGVKDSPAIPGPSCWIRGIRRKPTKNSPSDPISPFKEVLVLTNPPKSKESSCHVSCGRAIHDEIPCRIFGRRERAARLFIHPRVSLQWFWWVLVAKTQKIGPLFPHILGQKFPTENLQSKVACRCW